jgi:hypothetical protein
MTATSEPRPKRGVAMAPPAVDTWEGVLEADGWGVAAVVEGAGVTPGTEEEPATDEAGAEEGASLRGEVAVDPTKVEADLVGGRTGPDEAGGASPDDADGAGGTSTDEAAEGGGAYEWPGGAGAGPVWAGPVMQVVSVTVTVTWDAQAARFIVNLCYIGRTHRSYSRWEYKEG